MCDPDYVLERLFAVNKTESEDKTPVSLQINGKNCKPAVFLQTVTAWAENKNKRRLSRILFDSSSQRSFITEELSQRLGCKQLGMEILTFGVFRGESTERMFRRVQLTLRDQRYYKKYEIDMLETPTICEQNLPSPD